MFRQQRLCISVCGGFFLLSYISWRCKKQKLNIYTHLSFCSIPMMLQPLRETSKIENFVITWPMITLSDAQRCIGSLLFIGSLLSPRTFDWSRRVRLAGCESDGSSHKFWLYSGDHASLAWLPAARLHSTSEYWAVACWIGVHYYKSRSCTSENIQVKSCLIQIQIMQNGLQTGTAQNTLQPLRPAPLTRFTSIDLKICLSLLRWSKRMDHLPFCTIWIKQVFAWMLSGVQLLDLYKEIVESRWTVPHEKALAVPWKHGDIGGTPEQRYDIYI